MKRQVRKGVFETNSSSMHSLTMCLESDYDKWIEGKVFLFKGYESFYKSENRPEYNHFYTREEVIEFEKMNQKNINGWSSKELKDLFRENGWFDYNDYWHICVGDSESFEETMKTPGGETVVAFGYYGWD